MDEIPQNTTKFGIGNPGKPKGTLNKLTRSAKNAFAAAFEQLGGAEALAVWAADNRTDFYKLYARMIPVEMTGEDGGPMKASLLVQYVRPPSVAG